MKKDLIEKLYKLLSSPNGAKLAFKMANSLGYTDEGLIQLMWDKYSIEVTNGWDQLDLNYYKLRCCTVHNLWSIKWNNIGHCSSKKSTVDKLIEKLKNE